MLRPRAVWDRNLWQVLFEQPKLGTLRLEQAKIDAERLADGKIDLYETLRPILGREPEDRSPYRGRRRSTAISHRGAREARRLGTHGRHDRDTSDAATAPVVVPVGEWSRPKTRKRPSLEGEGNFDQWAAKAGRAGDLDLRVGAQSWPFLVGDGGEGTKIGGELNAKVAVRREGGKWSLTGDGRLARLDVESTALRKSPLAIEGLHGQMNRARSEGGAIQVVGRIETEDEPDADRRIRCSIEGSLAMEKETIDLPKLASRLISRRLKCPAKAI